MKLLVAGTALLAGFANAGLDKIANDLGSLVAQNSSLWNDRSITTMLGNLGSVIDTYGCWCYFDANHGKGKGRPVNDVDKVCKQTAHAYDCAIMDNGDTCVPWEVFYISGIAQGIDQLPTQCDLLNTDPCAAAACKIEGYFVLKFFQLMLLTGSGIDNTYQHANPVTSFNPELDCPMLPGSPDDERQCCGEQPFRFKYKPFDGGKACCGTTVYPTMIQQCCPDNIPRVSC